MDIAKINELLEENEEIRVQARELNKKSKQKKYSREEKSEFLAQIEKLKEKFLVNQIECANLSEIKTLTFAKLVSKVLGQAGMGSYQIKYQLCDLSKVSVYQSALKQFNPVAKSIVLVLSKGDARLNEDSLKNFDINCIPIAFKTEMKGVTSIDEVSQFLIEEEKMTLFEDVNFSNVLPNKLDYKPFNLGEPNAKKDGVNPDLFKLRELIKQELGIYSKEKIKQKGRQI